MTESKKDESIYIAPVESGEYRIEIHTGLVSSPLHGMLRHYASATVYKQGRSTPLTHGPHETYGITQEAAIQTMRDKAQKWIKPRKK